MGSKKRISEETLQASQRKRARLSDVRNEENKLALTDALPGEVDFPRGGGTSFTAAEYKSIKAEAIKELKEEDVFKETSSGGKKAKINRKTRPEANFKADKAPKISKESGPRVEHLNYKRVIAGMKLLCQVISISPLALIVSLPNQLLGHIPITNISSQLTSQLEAIDEKLATESIEANGGDSDDESHTLLDIDLAHYFRPGQYLRAVVTAVKPAGVTDERLSRHLKDEVEKGSRRVELSLIPRQVNQGLAKADLVKGLTMPAAIKSVEDHGYTLDIGLADVSGFVRFAETQGKRWKIGALLDVVVERLADDGRTCLFAFDGKVGNSLSKISNVSSILPGTLVDALVTSTSHSGITTQILGSFVGTIDLYHLPSGSTLPDFSEGMNIRSRILYDVTGSSPPQFALSAKEHIINLDVKRLNSAAEKTIQNAYPVGTVLPSVKVKRVEPERGLIVAVGDDLDGFIHISHVSDEHVPSLATNSGAWKIGTEHRARVTGYHPLDAVLQLSLRESVLSQKFLRVEDVVIGEVIKGTVKKLTESALFIAINGNVDGMIWPTHYADIRLKHPERRFKPGTVVKARVLAVDPSRKRIMLTAKKSLIESSLTIIRNFSDAKAGLLTHGVIYKIFEKSLLVEFFGNVKAIVPMREVSDGTVLNIHETFPVGKTVKVRLLTVDSAVERIVASIRQAAGAESEMGSISDIEVGQAVSGNVKEVHRDNVLLVLKSPRVIALISINNVANRRKISVENLRSSLRIGEEMDNLVVVSRNLEKGIVIVAHRPSPTQQDKDLIFNLDDLKTGSIVKGRVIKHGRHGALVRFPGRIVGTLHPTDVSDDFEEDCALPAIDSIITAAVVSIDVSKKQLTLSTRKSRLGHSATETTDREIGGVEDVKIGESLRGYIKSVTEHGLFVTIGRNVDARVQIKELYDEYIKDWKAGFSVNQLVAGRILSVDMSKKQVEMSLRSETVNKQALTFGDLEEGKKVDGKVKKVEDFGIFIQIEGSRLSGLCHKSEIADNKDADVNMALRNFREGDLVKAVVLKIDPEKRRISLGLKPSYFAEAVSTNEQSWSSEDEGTDVVMNDADQESYGEASLVDDSPEDDRDEERPAFAVDEITIGHSPSDAVVDKRSEANPVLSLSGFQWNPKAENFDSEESTSDEDEPAKPDKKRKKKKVIERDLTADMHTRMPESVADFERHLLASPNSSFLWIQYMSFQLQLSEIEKAKEVGRRALQVISIREEQEKLNVWIALLNLEVTYGNDETVESLFKEASRYNDSKTIHLRLAAIYDQSDKPLKAEEQFKKTCKKFGKSSKVWTLFGEHYSRRGLLEDARKLLPRSLQSLEKRKHLKTISKFAQLEYKLGDPERGKTIFEGIIDSHPKRWDIWSIYADMEASQKNIQSTRSIFDRIFVHKMTSHKAKAFFKKWLEIERRIGDEEGQNVVKERAIEWAQRTSN